VRHLLLLVAPGVALAVAGCNSLLGIGDLELASDGGPGRDGGAPIDAPPGSICHGTVVQACLLPPEPGDLSLFGEIDTAADPRCIVVPQSTGVDVCAMHAESFSIAQGGIAVRGPRPLMLVATTTITIGQPVTVGSEEDQRGAGSNPSACSVPGPGANSGEHGAGGGAGGSFGGPGARGGSGGGPNGGLGASPSQIVPIVGLRGGCDGSPGGTGSGASEGAGRPGLGGGAIYLVAGTGITIAHRLDASGGGGEGGVRNQSGGGGGGAGGMIALEAPTITIAGGQAAVLANGGGGGEGSTQATSGDDGDVSGAWNQAAPGGEGNTVLGGDGGHGATRAAMAELGSNGTTNAGNEGGGGGGGGGVGVVLTLGTVTGADAGKISPAPVTSL